MRRQLGIPAALLGFHLVLHLASDGVWIVWYGVRHVRLPLVQLSHVFFTHIFTLQQQKILNALPDVALEPGRSTLCKLRTCGTNDILTASISPPGAYERSWSPRHDPVYVHTFCPIKSQVHDCPRWVRVFRAKPSQKRHHKADYGCLECKSWQGVPCSGALYPCRIIKHVDPHRSVSVG